MDDTLKAQMNNFLLSTASQQEIQVIHIIRSVFHSYITINNRFYLESG